MQSTRDGGTDFHQELSQLVHKHLNSDTDPEQLLDALEIQTELVRTRSGDGSPVDTEVSAETDDESRFTWE